MATRIKTCTACGETKWIEEFSPSRNGRAAKKPIRKPACKPCQAAATRRWRAANIEYNREANRRRAFVRSYGITLDEYEKLRADQGGVCAICGKDQPGIDRRTGKPRRLAVDHCHETARVRGLLCGNCNVGLGMFADNPGLLRRALGYVEGGGRHRNEN